MRYLVLALLVTIACARTLAATTVETVSVTATGDNEVAAISKALAQAVQQVNGVDVHVINALTATEPQILIDWLGNKIVLEGGRINKGITVTEAAGPVRRYTVTDSKPQGERWQATIEADIVHYKAWNSDKIHLPTLAISPFEADRKHYETLTGRVAATKLAGRLQQLLNHQFSQSGRFRMLDRRFVEQAMDEHRFTTRFSGIHEHDLRNRQKLGADVLLVGMIREFELSKSREKLYDSYNDLYHGDFLFDIQAVEVATGEILWSERIKQRYTHQQLRTELRKLMNGNITDGKALQQAEQDLQARIEREQALAISRAVIGYFYPVRVLQADADTVYLSQGQGIVQAGDIYRIAVEQAQLTDPETGRTVKADQKTVKVRVQAVMQQYARAVVIEGDGERIGKGMPARYLAETDRVPLPDSQTEDQLTPGSSAEPLNWR